MSTQPTAWRYVPGSFALKECPACGMPALPHHAECRYCGERPEDDTSWQSQPFPFRAASPPVAHAHEWQFGGLRYREGQPLPHGAQPRIYFDWFYCLGCLQYAYRNRREIGSTLSEPIAGALPQ